MQTADCCRKDSEEKDMDEDIYTSTRERAEANAQPLEHVVPVTALDFGVRARPADWAHPVTVIGIERVGEYVKVFWEVAERVAPDASTVFHETEFVISSSPAPRRDETHAVLP